MAIADTGTSFFAGPKNAVQEIARIFSANYDKDNDVVIKNSNKKSF